MHYIVQPCNYSCPLNNMDLNCAGPLTGRFFSINTYYSTTNPWFVESLDVELRIERASCKVILGFLPAWGWRPNPCIVQGSAVLSEVGILITFKIRKLRFREKKREIVKRILRKNICEENYNFMNKPEKVCEKHTGINDQVCE